MSINSAKSRKSVGANASRFNKTTRKRESKKERDKEREAEDGKKERDNVQYKDGSRTVRRSARVSF